MRGPFELIADIGGSSSRWALLGSDGSTRSIANSTAPLPGFNPAVHEPTVFIRMMRQAFLDAGVLEAGPVRLTAYGAGCGTDERKQRMRDVLAEILPMGAMVVETDLLGAARGLLGDKPGLVLILGTGMNAGWYEGSVLDTPMPSLGWILGDEGSGADIGKRLLNDAVHGRIPSATMQAIFGADRISASTALELITANSSPNSAVAALAGRLVAVAEDRYVRELLADRFAALASLLRSYFGSYAPCTITATGGIANAFHNALRTGLAHSGFDLQRVSADPMDGLIQWHRVRVTR